MTRRVSLEERSTIKAEYARYLALTTKERLILNLLADLEDAEAEVEQEVENRKYDFDAWMVPDDFGQPQQFVTVRVGDKKPPHTMPIAVAIRKRKRGETWEEKP